MRTRLSGQAATRTLATVLIGLTLAHTGCSHRSEPLGSRLRADVVEQSHEARDHGFDRLADALADGEYTDEENAALFSLYQECVTKAGIPLDEPEKSPIDGRTLLVWPKEDADWSAAQGEEQYQCLHRYSAQGPVFGEDPGPMAEPLRRFVLSCMKDAGERTNPKDRTMREILTTAGGRAGEGAFNRCVDAGMDEEYPELGYSYGTPSIY